LTQSKEAAEAEASMVAVAAVPDQPYPAKFLKRPTAIAT
jgi:hypothetical protein